MKALPVEKLPESDWVYEIKFDEGCGSPMNRMKLL
jgi:hypothetical protein